MVAALHLVRLGNLGVVGRFQAADGCIHPRHARVVCRTARGLEVGQVLSATEQDSPADGALLRRVTVADDLLLSRLERDRDEAFRSCQQLLEERGLPAVLMDVEHLFDGRSLYFYFLGEVTPELEELTAELAATYETRVQFQKFAETLSAGCGPGCGTDEAAGQGCSTGGCASCAVAGACGTRGAAG